MTNVEDTLKKYKADLHIHSCLSRCADWDMSPRPIIQRSQEVGLDLIAICDHNTAKNAEAAVREGQKKAFTFRRAWKSAFIEDLGKVWTVFRMAGPTVEEVRQSLLQLDGRRNVV